MHSRIRLRERRRFGWLPTRLRVGPDVTAHRRRHPYGMAYCFVEHVGEVEIDLRASSLAGVFDAALEAFAELVASDGKGAPERRVVELCAEDRALLLADWLSELVFLAEVEQFVPTRVRAFELDGDHLRATLEGHRGEPRPLVKAVTLNNLRLEPEGGIWHGRVVVDV